MQEAVELLGWLKVMEWIFSGVLCLLVLGGVVMGVISARMESRYWKQTVPPDSFENKGTRSHSHSVHTIVKESENLRPKPTASQMFPSNPGQITKSSNANRVGNRGSVSSSRNSTTSSTSDSSDYLTTAVILNNQMSSFSGDSHKHHKHNHSHHSNADDSVTRNHSTNHHHSHSSHHNHSHATSSSYDSSSSSSDSGSGGSDGGGFSFD